MSDDTGGTIVDDLDPPPVDPPSGPPPGSPSGADGSPSGADGPPPERGSRTAGDVVRLAVRGVGQTLITAGLVILLFVVYQVYITNYFAERAQDKVHTALEKQWENDTLDLPQSQVATADGHGIANLYIPRFGNDYAKTIVTGTGAASLEKGPGHYNGTQLPGQKGDFAIAGHRVGKGEPFLNLDKVKAGDPIIVETQTTWFVYCVLGAATPADACNPNAAGGSLARTDANGVPGREIVSPSQGEVVLPVPSKPDATAPYSTAYMTITTCHPKFVANKRMIIHAVLAQSIPKAKAADGKYSTAKPPAIKAMYTEVGV